MWDRVRQLPPEQFAAIWNAADSLAQAAERVRQAVGGPAPRWAVLARAGQLRAEGVELKPLPTSATIGVSVGPAVDRRG